MMLQVEMIIQGAILGAALYKLVRQISQGRATEEDLKRYRYIKINKDEK